eukprot:s284_g7.t1
MQPRCRLLMAKGELRSNDRVRLWQEVRDDYRWEWQVPSGLYLMANEEKRPTTGAPSEWHPDFMFLGIERNHPLYQCRTSILPQRAGFLAAMGQQQWRHGGYWYVVLKMDAAIWLKISRPRTASVVLCVDFGAETIRQCECSDMPVDSQHA